MYNKSCEQTCPNTSPSSEALQQIIFCNLRATLKKTLPVVVLWSFHQMCYFKKSNTVHVFKKQKQKQNK